MDPRNTNYTKNLLNRLRSFPSLPALQSSVLGLCGVDIFYTVGCSMYMIYMIDVMLYTSDFIHVRCRRRRFRQVCDALSLGMRLSSLARSNWS